MLITHVLYQSVYSVGCADPCKYCLYLLHEARVVLQLPDLKQFTVFTTKKLVYLLQYLAKIRFCLAKSVLYKDLHFDG